MKWLQIGYDDNTKRYSLFSIDGSTGKHNKHLNRTKKSREATLFYDWSGSEII